MESDGSLSCSQEPTSYTYPESYESIQNLPPCYSKINLILPSHLRQDLPSDLFSAALPNKTLYEFLISPMRATCPPISFSLNWSP
jgi:hypothetical protein